MPPPRRAVVMIKQIGESIGKIADGIKRRRAAPSNSPPPSSAKSPPPDIKLTPPPPPSINAGGSELTPPPASSESPPPVDKRSGSLMPNYTTELHTAKKQGEIKMHKLPSMRKIKRSARKAVDNEQITALNNRKNKHGEYMRYPRRDFRAPINACIETCVHRAELSDYNRGERLKFAETRTAICIVAMRNPGISEFSIQRAFTALHNCGVLTRERVGAQGVTIRKFAPEFFTAIECDIAVWYLQHHIKPQIESARIMRAARSGLANEKMAQEYAPPPPNAPPVKKRRAVNSPKQYGGATNWLDAMHNAKNKKD